MLAYSCLFKIKIGTPENSSSQNNSSKETGAYRRGGRGGRNAPPAFENFLFFLLTKILKIEKKIFSCLI